MEISFETNDLYVGPHDGRNVHVTANVDGSSIAAELSDDDRLEGLNVEVVRAWLLKNDNHDDILEDIGLDKIHEFLSHCD